MRHNPSSRKAMRDADKLAAETAEETRADLRDYSPAGGTFGLMILKALQTKPVWSGGVRIGRNLERDRSAGRRSRKSRQINRRRAA